MSRCEHNQKIVKFCITQGCNYQLAGGCQYCIKRYHCHIGQVDIIKEAQISDMMKYLTSFQDKKPKIRPFKQAIYNYFNIVKGQISVYLDCLSTDLTNKISYSYISKQGYLPVFKKLRHKQYNKVTGSQLQALVKFKKSNDGSKLQSSEVHQYLQVLQDVFKQINQINQLYKGLEIVASNSYQGQNALSVSIFYQKINQIFDAIQIEKQKRQLNPPKKLYEISLQKKPVDIRDPLEQTSQTPTFIFKEPQFDSKPKQQPQKKSLPALDPSNLQQITRPRRISLQNRFDYSGSGTKSYQQKQRQITQIKRRLEQIMGVGKSDQPTKDSKNSPGDISQNQAQITVRGVLQLGVDLYRMGQTLLPAGTDPQGLYEQQSVGRRTLKVPVRVQEIEEVQSPILKLKRASTKTEFTLGIKPITQETPQQNFEPLIEDKEIDLDPLDLSDREANSLLLLVQSLKLPSRQAIPLLEAALKYSSENFSAAEYLSFLLLEENMPKQCLKVCNQALKFIANQPNSVEISYHLFNNKGAALNMLGRSSQAISVLESALTFKKKDILYKNLGDSYFNLGIVEKAIINYENAVILNDQNHEALYNLAACLYTQKNYSSAKLKLQRALMFDPKNEGYKEFYQEIENTLKQM